MRLLLPVWWWAMDAPAEERFLQVLVLWERLWAASPKHGKRAELGV